MFSDITSNPIEAILFGNEEASMIHALRTLLQENRQKNLNYRNGKYWVTSTARELVELWPYWSEAQICYRLMKLRKKGVLIAEICNKFKQNRTMSYTFADDKLIEGYRTWADVDAGILSAFMSGKSEKALARYGLAQGVKTAASVCKSSQEDVGKISHLNSENGEMHEAESLCVIREDAEMDAATFADVKYSNSHITSGKIVTSLKRREDTNTQVFVSSSPQKERVASPCQAEVDNDSHRAAHSPAALHDLPDFVLLWDRFVRLYNEFGRANGVLMDASTAEDFTSILCELADPVGVLTEALRLGCTDLRMVAERVEKQTFLTSIARQAYKSGQAPGFTQDAAANRILASALAAEPQEWPTRMQWEMAQQPTSCLLAIEYLKPLFEPKAQALTALYNSLVQANRISGLCIGGGQ